MAKYKIVWAQEKKKGETNGRPWVITNMTLEDEQGNTTENVSTFDPVMSGGTIEGTIVKKGEYLNFSKLEPPEFIKKQQGILNYKSQQIEKVMDKKEASISHFQDKKEENIALAGAQRDAVLIVTMIYNNLNHPNESVEAIKEHIIKWRNWFLSDSFRISPPFDE